MAGAFFSEGSYTKNSEAEVERMCDSLECWANGRAGEVPKPLPAATLKEPIPPMEGSIDLPSFMGRWYVIASIPTWFEKGATNCVEEYVWEELPEGNGRVGVTFSYNKAGSSSRSEMLQRATISNAPSNTVWAVSPKTLGVYVPLGLGYIIVHVQPDYSWVIVSLSDRSNFWLMTRSPLMQADDYRIALRRADALGFNMAKVIKVHHDASVGVGSGGEKAAAGVEPEPEPAPPILQQHTLPSVFDASRDSFPAGESPDSPALEGASAEAVTPETEEDEGFTAL
jgi:apolipoprotein D and lipocalin family protein